MVVLESHFLDKFKDISFGLSTKFGLNRKAPHFFNTSKSVGDDEQIVEENRNAFYAYFNLTNEQIALQKQEHTDIVTIVERPGFVGESDAMITNIPNIGIVVSTADCGNIYVFDQVKKVIAGIHSGWRGTQKRIVEKTIIKMEEHYKCNPKDLVVYIGTAISKKHFEVKEDVAKLFEEKYIIYREGKIFIDLIKMNYEMVLGRGVPKDNIQVSNLCSFNEANLFHSYRRDGKFSGRAFGLIVLRSNNG